MSRTEQIASERRRRGDHLSGARRKLAVDESALDRTKYEYRFINDVKNRVYDMTVNDDWDIVPDRSNAVKTDGAAEGAQVAVNAGVDDQGKPFRSVLVRKLKTYYNDDFAASQRRIDEQEAGLREAPALAGDANQSYVPDGQSALKVGI